MTLAMRRYVIADVFTDTPLEGNPVAVFTDATGLSTEVMQRAARELNLSETVFVLRSEHAHLRVRIFTPRSSCRLPATRSWGRRSWSAGPWARRWFGSRPGSASLR